MGYVMICFYRIMERLDPLFDIKKNYARVFGNDINDAPSLEEYDDMDDTYPPEMLEDMRMEMNSLRQIPTEEGLQWSWGIQDNRIFERLIKKHFKKR